MIKNMKKFFWIGIISSLAFFACISKAEEQAKEMERLQAEADSRVASYVAIVEKNCREKVLTEAIRIADSILVLEARRSTDTLFKPLKPLRPEKPEIQILQDSTPIKPFLKRDTIKH